MSADDVVTGWARFLMSRPGVVLPSYGSDEWAAAPEVVKVAACVRAAEAWRQECDPHRLAVCAERELEAERRAQEKDYAAWRRIALGVRNRAQQPTHAELVELRAVGGAR